MSRHSEEQVAIYNRANVGFWLYLMTDVLLFGSLFATFVVLRNATAAGPSGSEIFELPVVLTETIILLLSSFTCGLAMIGLRQKNLKLIIGALIVTYVLGVSFLTIELNEFVSLIGDGHSWQQSAFLSAFFTLVGTHGLHITIGLLWLLVFTVRLLKKGIDGKSRRQLMLFAMFWHFLDLIWIFIFTVVYLMGVIS